MGHAAAWPASDTASNSRWGPSGGHSAATRSGARRLSITFMGINRANRAGKWSEVIESRPVARRPLITASGGRAEGAARGTGFGSAGRFLADLPPRWDGQRLVVIGHVATRWALDHVLRGVPVEDLLAEDFGWRPGWSYTLDT